MHHTHPDYTSRHAAIVDEFAWAERCLTRAQHLDTRPSYGEQADRARVMFWDALAMAWEIENGCVSASEMRGLAHAAVIRERMEQAS